jgi:transposase
MTVYIGIDWSEKKHDLCFQNEVGEVLLTQVIEHSPNGFLQIDQARQRLGIDASECVVGIETAHNVLIDYLLEHGYAHLYVLPPNVVKSAQSIDRQSGAKSDLRDAQLIAKLLRTNRAQYHAWVPDRLLTRNLRAKISLIDFINKDIWRLGNRLWSALVRYYPTMLALFPSLDSQITLAWIQTYPTPGAAQAVDVATFQEFLRSHHHPKPKLWAKYYARLQQLQVQASLETVEIFAPEAQSLAKHMLELVKERLDLLKLVGQLFEQHPDAFIYQSLPAAGDYLEPALLAMLGDDRQRYPTPASLQALAGTCPVTKQSGKTRIVTFRRACDHQFRQIMQQWAKLSIAKSPWAAGYYQMVRPHCESENEAYRKLANRWLEVLWRLWQDRQAYDEPRHLSAHARRMKPKA